MTDEYNHEQEQQFINLTDEEGNVQEFEVVLSFEHEEQEYAVLYLVDESEGEEAVIFKVIESGEEVTFENLTDEEFEKIAKVYYEIVNENE